MRNLFLIRKTMALFSLALLPLAAFADRVSSNNVYSESNATDGNRVLVFSRESDGHLRADGSFPTGGLGTGKGLGNQGAVIMSENDRWLLAVNAGSSEISVFAVRHGDLILTDIVPSGGATPISLTIDKNLVYALNAGGATDQKLWEKELILDMPNPRADFSLSSANSKKFPTGDYKIDIYLDDELVDTVRYKVQ